MDTQELFLYRLLVTAILGLVFSLCGYLLTPKDKNHKRK